MDEGISKELIPGYEVEEMIGKGGMGMVWRARQISLDRIVAIKVLPQQLGSSPEYVERFLREARLAARLNHAHVVTVFDAGVCDTVYFMVMEFVDGKSLGQILRESGAIEERTALGWISQAAKGLAYAHSQGIVHRDVKPENMLLTSGGIVKVGDLGLAKMSSSETDMTLTATGAAMGTPYYISPEQIRGWKDIDGRSDIYSLGMSLYHMLSGKPSFPGGSAAEIMALHLTEEMPPLQNASGSLSQDTLNLVAKMTAKARDARIQEMSQVAAALDAILAGHSMPGLLQSNGPPGSTPSPGKKNKRVTVLVAAGIAILLVLIVGLMSQRNPNKEPPISDKAIAKTPPAKIADTHAPDNKPPVVRVEEPKATENEAAIKIPPAKIADVTPPPSKVTPTPKPEEPVVPEKASPSPTLTSTKSDDNTAIDLGAIQKEMQKALIGQDPARPVNPALAAAKLMVAMNPNMEIVSTDDATGAVKIRDKSSGESVTLNLKDFQKSGMLATDPKLDPPKGAQNPPLSLPAQIITRETITAYDIKSPGLALGSFQANTTLTIVELSKETGMYRVHYVDAKSGAMDAFCKIEAIAPLLKAPAAPSRTNRGE